MENMKEVYFDQYCPNCKYLNEDQASDVCHDCLNEPARQYSHKPLNYKEADN